MKEISYLTAPGSLNLSVGFGTAGYQIVTALQKLGHKVPYGDKRADILFNFCQPVYAEEPRDNREDILYVPFESTILPEGWVETMNTYDQVWTTSELCRDIFIDNGVKLPVKVYHHGIEEDFKPKKRKRKEKLRFLISGGEAPRKNAQEGFEAFRAAFGDQDDVTLTIKCNGQSLVRAFDKNGNFGGIADKYSNVKLDTRNLPRDIMINYYYQHDVMLVPSYGEGFGLPGLEAVGSGMPTIVNKWWCPYSNYTIPLDYELVDSPVPLVHPGKMAKPDFAQMVHYLQQVYEHFELYSTQAYKNAFKVHEVFDWTKLTENAFEEVFK